MLFLVMVNIDQYSIIFPASFCGHLSKSRHSEKPESEGDREFFADNLLVRIH